MGKGITLAGMVIAALVFLVSLADLVTPFPFRDASTPLMDVLFLICALLLGYLSWSTYRELE